MRTLFALDDVSRLHLNILKTTLLGLLLLPLAQVALSVWVSADEISQIVVGFMLASVFFAVFLVSFWLALKMSSFLVEFDEKLPPFERSLVKYYQQLPMICVVAISSYLAVSFISQNI